MPLISVFLLLFLPLFSRAQKLEIILNGIVSINSKEIFIIKSKQDLTNTNFTINSLSGEEQKTADAPVGADYICVIIKNSADVMFFLLTIGTKKVFAKELVHFGIIDTDGIKEIGVQRFATVYGTGGGRKVLGSRFCNRIVGQNSALKL